MDPHISQFVIPGWAVSILGGLVPLALGWLIILNRQLSANEKEIAVLTANFKNLTELMQDLKISIDDKFEKLNVRFDDVYFRRQTEK